MEIYSLHRTYLMGRVPYLIQGIGELFGYAFVEKNLGWGFHLFTKTKLSLVIIKVLFLMGQKKGGIT